MIVIRTTAATIAMFHAVVLTACAVAPSSAPEVPAAAESRSTAAALPTDEQMCQQYADALTLFLNMRLADGEGRLAPAERDGVQRLTMRMINDISLDESTDVGAALAALQRRVADALGGGSGQDLDLGESWAQGTLSDPVQSACTDAVVGWGIAGWVGG